MTATNEDSNKKNKHYLKIDSRNYSKLQSSGSWFFEALFEYFRHSRFNNNLNISFRRMHTAILDDLKPP